MKKKTDYAIEIIDSDGKFQSQIDVACSFEEAEDWLKYFAKEKMAKDNERYRIIAIEYDENENEKIIDVMAEYNKFGKKLC